MFVKNYFLIEAYAVNMTYKLAIVESLNCGGLLSACMLLFEQYNCVFNSNFMLMLTAHSL